MIIYNGEFILTSHEIRYAKVTLGAWGTLVCQEATIRMNRALPRIVGVDKPIVDVSLCAGSPDPGVIVVFPT